MKTYGIGFWSVIFLAIFLPLMVEFASAEEKFPSRPVTIIVPFAPGGGTEINAQMVRPHLQKSLGVSMVITPKPGGSTTIGANFVANSPPDGYTLMAHSTSLICTRYTVKSGVSYEKFEPIIRTVAVPSAVTVRADAPWKTFKEFIEYGKANPGKILEGHSGVGATAHLAAVGLEMATGMKITHVPFKGAAPSITALIGGHIHCITHDLFSPFAFIEAGKLKVLAISSPERSPILPDVPTFKEYGFDLDVGTWVIYFAPKGTPKDRIQILHNAFKGAMNTKEHQELYKQRGGIVEYMDLEKLAAYLDQQDKLWKKIVDFAGIQPAE